MIDADAINAAYSKLHDAHIEVFNMTGGVLDAKEKLAVARAALLDSGEIDGKNAETREAQLQTRSQEEVRRLGMAEGMARQADLRLRCAQLEVERCKTLLKYMEVAK